MNTKILALTAPLIFVLTAFPTEAAPNRKAPAEAAITETTNKHHGHQAVVAPHANVSAGRHMLPATPPARPAPVTQVAAMTPRPAFTVPVARPAVIRAPAATPAVVGVPHVGGGVGTSRAVVSGPVVIGRPAVLRAIETPLIRQIRARWEFAPEVNFVALDTDAQREAELLREAYVLMAHANHDYYGHRWNAMIRTKNAGRILGVELHGDGRINQAQDASDQQMQDAAELLKQAESQLDEKALLDAAHEAGLAVGQVGIALNVR